MRSVSCRQHDAFAGFTLIEIVVALAVVGLIAGLVIPVAGGWLARLKRSSQLGEIEDTLANLPQQARRTGHTISLQTIVAGQEPAKGPEKDQPIRLQPGWGMVVEAPIVFRYDGFCTGGSLRLTSPGGEAAYRLAPPFCQPQRL